MFRGPLVGAPPARMLSKWFFGHNSSPSASQKLILAPLESAGAELGVKRSGLGNLIVKVHCRARTYPLPFHLAGPLSLGYAVVFALKQ